MSAVECIWEQMSTSTPKDKASLRRLDFTKLCLGVPLPGDIFSINGKRLVPISHTLTLADLEGLIEEAGRGLFGDENWPEDFFDDAPDNEEGAGIVSTLGKSPFEDDGPDWDSLDVSAAETVQLESVPTPVETSPETIAQTARPLPISSGYVDLPVGSLRVGMELARDIYGQNGVLLLAAGSTITEQFLHRLSAKGVYKVRTTHDRVAVPLEVPVPDREPWVVDRLDRLLITGEVDACIAQANKIKRLPLSQLQEATCEGEHHYGKCVDRLSSITMDICRGSQSAVSAAVDVVSQFVGMVQLDSGLLPAIMQLKTSPNEYLFHHGMNVALLSMTVAGQMGLPRDEILSIGMGALLQDVGMMCIPEGLRLALRALTPEERKEVDRHPLYSLNFLENVTGISQKTLLIVYQSHERNDSQGYPHGRHPMLIHPYAKLVAIADTYTALASDRPYRNAMSPYDAIVAVLRGAGKDQYDRHMMRAFLDTVSLFPIGSFVRLSNGTIGKVLRANPGKHTCPVVLLIDGDGCETATEIDLSQPGMPKVIEALREAVDSELKFFGM